MLDEEIVRNCAATLAGLKTGSLFNYRIEDENLLQEELRGVNSEINDKGVFAEKLTQKDGHALIYLYRKSSLIRDLSSESVHRLLKGYGYKSSRIDRAISHLKERLDGYSCFPHEIGVFLGYPAEDVIGFIENNGRDCKCCGLWKVYCDEGEKLKLFEKINKCSKIYSRVFAEGRSITQMTVSA